jgi:uncharacterized NAD-dependent epimerase/dehydratase family protein
MALQHPYYKVNDNTKSVILVDGFDGMNSAKTAINLIRYNPSQVVGLIDSRYKTGTLVKDILGVGNENIIFYKDIADVKYADQMILGISPAGGAIPLSWREYILTAINRKWDIVSGLHEFLNQDQEFLSAAKKANIKLYDIRNTNFNQVATRKNISNNCLRIHTVGHDCNVGKMLVSYELSQALKEQGIDAEFVATGQTGVLLSGKGLPIDSIKADFINGAVEHLVRENQHHDIIIVEGQGSITNPMYSSVTLGLLHGSMPDGLILCYQADRTHYRHMDIKLPSLKQYIELYEKMASVNHPCKVIGIAMNGYNLTAEQAKLEKQKVAAETGLVVVDVVADSDGKDILIEKILELKTHLAKKTKKVS